MKIRTRTKILLAASGLLAIMLTAFFYGLPALLKAKLPVIIEQATGRKSSIASVRLTLLPLSVGLQGFEIKEHDGRTLASFDAFDVQINALDSLARSMLVVDRLSLNRPFVHIARRKDGVFNVNDLFPKKTVEQPLDNKPFPVALAKLTLSEGKLAWEDAALVRPVAETLYPLQLEVDGFTTEANKPAQLKLTFALGSGSHFDWTGTFSVVPVKVQGHLKLEQVDLQKTAALGFLDGLQGHAAIDADVQADYADTTVELAVTKAKLDVHGFQYAVAGQGQAFTIADFSHETDLNFNYTGDNWRLLAKNAKIDSRGLQAQSPLFANAAALAASAAYQLSYAGNGLNLVVNQGKIEGKDVQLRAAGQDKQLVKIPAIALDGIEFNLGDRQLNVASISAIDADLKAWLNADGVINYQALMPATPGNNGEAMGGGQKKSPWTIKAGNIALINCGLDFEDQTLAKPVAVSIKPINFKLTGYSNASGATLPFRLDAGINKTGLIALQGDTVISPFFAQIAVDVKNIDLDKFQAYFDKLIHLDVIDGVLAVDGRLAIANQEQGKPAVKFNGNTTIANLLTRDRRVHKDFVKWQKLTLKDIAMDLLAERYTAEALVIDKPYARVTIRKDKTVNFADIVLAGKSTSKPTAEKTADKPPYFRLGKIQVNDGSSDFTDLSLILPFSAHVQGLNGGASGVSSEKNSTVNAALKGNAYDLAPVDVAGKISPYLGEYDVNVNFKGLPMPLVSPYMVQFASYKVEKGKMSLGLNYKIANRQLTATNSLLIDQFELGEKVENPNAVSIPLKLAIALLKDSSGRIKFDVPITGSLEDPKFSLGAVVTDALVNAIGKVVASPFNALASLATREGDLSTVGFSAGSASLEPRQKQKLDELAKALRERPKLTLDIKGMVFQRQDWPAISDDALYDQLKIRRAAEINKQGVIKIRPEYVELSREDYRRLLADLFIEKFPLLAEKSLLGEPKLKNDQAGNFYDVAKQKLMEVIKPEQERLKELAAARAQAIAKYLVRQGKVPQERVYILDTVVDAGKTDTEIPSTLILQAE